MSTSLHFLGLIPGEGRCVKGDASHLRPWGLASEVAPTPVWVCRMLLDSDLGRTAWLSQGGTGLACSRGGALGARHGQHLEGRRHWKGEAWKWAKVLAGPLAPGGSPSQGIPPKIPIQLHRVHRTSKSQGWGRGAGRKMTSWVLTLLRERKIGHKLH